MTREILADCWSYLQEPPLLVGVGILGAFCATVITLASVIGGGR